MKYGTPFEGMPIALIRPPGRSTTRGKRIAGAQLARDGLGDEGAKPAEVHHPVQAFGKGAGGRHHGIGAASGRRRCTDRSSHGSASIMSKTGPSQHTRR